MIHGKLNLKFITKVTLDTESLMRIWFELIFIYTFY